MRPDEIGAEIRRLRLRRGWSLAELARRAGTSAPTVHRYEGGWRRFEVATLAKLAGALGRRLDVRFVGTPAPGRAAEGRDVARRLRRLFWDGRIRSPDLRRHAAWVVRRVLELGALDDVRVLERYYGREAFLALVAGARFESPRTRAFWESMLELEGHRCTTRFSRREADACWMP